MNAAPCAGSEHGFVAGLKIGSSLPGVLGNVMLRGLAMISRVRYGSSAVCDGGAACGDEGKVEVIWAESIETEIRSYLIPNAYIITGLST